MTDLPRIRVYRGPHPTSCPEVLPTMISPSLEHQSDLAGTLAQTTESPQEIHLIDAQSFNLAGLERQLAHADSESTRLRRLEALHRAGRELIGLEPECLMALSVQERLDLLIENLRRCCRDLLHYETIEIRRLNRETGELELLLEEGMSAEAAARSLFAQLQGNGVTGYVATTGRSYLCPDTSVDPLYIEGRTGARSSMTVPLLHQDEVVGTLNVESLIPNAFGDEDLLYAELFCREVAAALQTLQLLSAGQAEMVMKSIERINESIALPADELLTLAGSLVAQMTRRSESVNPTWIGALHRILSNARLIKQSIHRVGEELAGVRPKPQTAEQTERLRGMRILLVDEEERIRRSAHSALERFGCLVETAKCGEEGLALAETTTYDAIISAVRLPDIGGYENYRRLKALQPGSRIILMNGFDYDGGHAIVKARLDGLGFVIYKPLRTEQLLRALLAPDPPPTSPIAPETRNSEPLSVP